MHVGLSHQHANALRLFSIMTPHARLIHNESYPKPTQEIIPANFEIESEKDWSKLLQWYSSPKLQIFWWHQLRILGTIGWTRSSVRTGSSSNTTLGRPLVSLRGRGPWDVNWPRVLSELLSVESITSVIPSVTDCIALQRRSDWYGLCWRNLGSM